MPSVKENYGGQHEKVNGSKLEPVFGLSLLGYCRNNMVDSVEEDLLHM